METRKKALVEYPDEIKVVRVEENVHTSCCFFHSTYHLIGKANKATSPHDSHPPVLSGAPVFIPSLWKVLPHLEHIQSCEIERG